MVIYTVYCVHDDRRDWADSLRHRLEETAANLGGRSSTVLVHDGLPGALQRDPSVPAMVVYLGSPAGAASVDCIRQVDEALADRLLVLPCVDRLANFTAHTPESLHRLNGVEWTAEGAPPAVVHFVLEALGLEERQRLAFLSHRRSDALALAEQLHDELVKNRFWPFVDRFDIAPAADVQQRIYAALEETAFVVLVESPDAALSDWVLEEVNYALAESLGMLIVTFPGTPPLPGTQDLPRFYLDAGDLYPDPGGQAVLTTGALGRLVTEIESIHAKALVRRRRRLVLNTRTKARNAGFATIELPGGVLLVVNADADGAADGGPPPYVVHFVPRPPGPADLFTVDAARCRHGDAQTEAVLVHATSRLTQDATELLTWCRADRKIRLIPDLLVGRDWMTP